MSTEPDDLLDGALDADALEQHLDAHPLPVNDDVVARVTARLQRHMEARPGAPAKPWPWLALGIAAAAAVLLVLASWSATTHRAATEGTTWGAPEFRWTPDRHSQESRTRPDPTTAISRPNASARPSFASSEAKTSTSCPVSSA